MAATPYPLPRSARQTPAFIGTGAATYGPFGEGWGIFDIEDVIAEIRPAGSTAPWAAVPVTIAKLGDSASYSTFNATFPAALGAATQFRLSGRRLHERSVAVTRGGGIDGKALEKELSKIGVTLQELRRDADVGLAGYVPPDLMPGSVSIEKFGVAIGSALDQTGAVPAAFAAAAALHIDLFVPGGAGIICNAISIDVPNGLGLHGGAGGGHFKRTEWNAAKTAPGFTLAMLEELPFFLMKDKKGVRMRGIDVVLDVPGTVVKRIVCAGGEGVSAPVAYANPDALPIRVTVNGNERGPQNIFGFAPDVRKLITAIALGASTVITAPNHRLITGGLTGLGPIPSTVQLSQRPLRVGTTTKDTFVALNPDGSAIDSTAYTPFSADPAATTINYLYATLSYVDSVAGQVWLSAAPVAGDILQLQPQVRTPYLAAFFRQRCTDCSFEDCTATGLWYIGFYGNDNIRVTHDRCAAVGYDNRGFQEIGSSSDCTVTNSVCDGRHVKTDKQAIGGLSGETYVAVTGITRANPPVFSTETSHGLANGQKFVVRFVSRMTEPNNQVFTAANVSANTVEASGVDGSLWQPYQAGGRIYKNLIAILSISNENPAKIAFDVSAGPIPYETGESVTPYGVTGLTDRYDIPVIRNVQMILDEVNQAAGTAVIRDFDARQYSPYLGGGYAQSNRAILTIVAHGRTNGEEVLVEDIGGPARLNGQSFEAANVTADTMQLRELGPRAYVDLLDAPLWTPGTGTLRGSLAVAVYGISWGASGDGLQKGGLIDGNIVKHTLDRMITIQGTQDGIRVLGNSLRHGKTAGIIVDSGVSFPLRNGIVQGNDIFNVAQAIYIIKSDRMIIADNSVRWAAIAALRLDQAHAGIVSNLQVRCPNKTASRGVLMAACDDWEFDGLNISGGLTGLDTADCKNNDFAGRIADAVNGIQCLTSVAGGLKTAARVRVTVNVNLAAPGATLDGLAMNNGEEALLDGQTDKAARGKYVWNGAAVPMTRSLDMNVWAEIYGAVVPVSAGTSAGTWWATDSRLSGLLDQDAIGFYQLATLENGQANRFDINVEGASVRCFYAGPYASSNRFTGDMLNGPAVPILDSSLYTEKSDFTQSRRNGVQTAFQTLTVAPASSQNDYDPFGMTAQWPIAGDATLRLNPATAIAITGFIGPRSVDLRNVTAEYPVVLPHESAASAAANRFNFAKSLERGHRVIWPGDNLLDQYDPAISRRRPRAAAERPQFFGWKRYALLPGTGTAAHALGQAANVSGTVSHPNASAGSYRTLLRRSNLSTGAGAGASAAIRGAYGVFRGDLAGIGGFLVHLIWSYAALPAAADSPFCGLFTGPPGNVDVSTLLNCIGYGKDPGETTLRFQNNDGAGTATRVDLGGNFPVNTTAVYEAYIHSAPNGAGLAAIVWRLDDLSIAPDIRYVSSDIPANTVLLIPLVHTCNRAAAADYQIESGLIEHYTAN